MDLTKSFFDSYSRKENSLDCVEKNYTKYPEPINRILQEKKIRGKKHPTPTTPEYFFSVLHVFVIWDLWSWSTCCPLESNMQYWKEQNTLLSYLLMVFVKAFHSSAAWIVFCHNLAQLYLTAKGAKSSGVFRHICDVIPYAVTMYLLCDVVCICPSRSFLSLSSSATHLFFFFFFRCAMFCFTLRAQTALARTQLLKLAVVWT